MSIHVNTTGQVAKSFAVKREKQPDDSEQVVAHLKIGEIMLDREQLDELCGQPIGWSEHALFDEFGAPRARLTLALSPRGKVTLSGAVNGGHKPNDPRLTLKDADVDSISLDLTKLGALLSCQLSWIAAGDEVDDIADMLGKTCNVVAVLHDGGQDDLLTPLRGLRNLAMRDGVESVEIRVGDELVASFGKDQINPTFNEAVAFVRETGKTKIVDLQKALKVGYNRAARILEALEAGSVIGPVREDGTREVLVGEAA